MKCYNKSCNNQIFTNLNNTTDQCNHCFKSFCSPKCNFFHIDSNNCLKSNLPNTTSNNNYQSLFKKTGKRLTSNSLNPYYSFNQFKFEQNDKTQDLTIISSGSFGNMFVAIHSSNHSHYAIQHIYKEYAIESGTSIETIKRGIAIQRKFIHDNILRLFSYHEDDINIYLIFEYMNNGTLHDLLQKKGEVLTEKKVFEYFIQITAAVEFLHENRIAHRDIRPESIQLDKNNHAKLSDFNWSVEIVDNKTRDTFCGTFEYMAPEMVNNKEYDFSVDIWALGILLYEMLHGYSPFKNKQDKKNDHEENYEAIIHNINQGEYKINEDFSEECKDLIGKLLEKDACKRMKVQEIYVHPWVLKYEKEMKMINHEECDNKKIKDKRENIIKSNQKENIIEKKPIYNEIKQCDMRNLIDNKKTNDTLFNDVLDKVEKKNKSLTAKKKKTNKNNIHHTRLKTEAESTNIKEWLFSKEFNDDHNDNNINNNDNPNNKYLIRKQQNNNTSNHFSNLLHQESIVNHNAIQPEKEHKPFIRIPDQENFLTKFFRPLFNCREQE